jgi:hypothetical protein
VIATPRTSSKRKASDNPSTPRKQSGRKGLAGPIQIDKVPTTSAGISTDVGGNLMTSGANNAGLRIRGRSGLYGHGDAEVADDVSDLESDIGLSVLTVAVDAMIMH